MEANFCTTNWSVIFRAGQDITSDGQAALESVCRNYWYPLYAHVRRLGWGPEDAQDLTQDFFARLLDKEYLKLADPQRGRFRTFLLTSLSRFVATEWEKRRALKRGATQTVPLIVMEGGEERYQHEPTDGISPDRIYEHRWATALLENVVGQLRAEYSATQKGGLFEALKGCVCGEAPADNYQNLSRLLGMSQGALRVATHRMRERYRVLLREAVAQTVAAPEDIDDELRHLITVLRL